MSNREVRHLRKYAKTDRERSYIDAVESEGSIRKAAKFMGVGVTTIRQSLDRIEARTTRGDGEYKGSSKQSENEARIRQLESLVAKQADHIDKMTKSKFKLPSIKKTKTSQKSFCRVIMPDTHGCLVDKTAISAFLGDLDTINPRQIIGLGDHLECGGFLAQHHTLGYVAQTEYTFQDDVNATNQLLDSIQSIAPGATIDYIEGNHERRIENWCTTQSLKNKQDASYLRSLFSADSVLHIEHRGIRWIRQGEYYDDIPLPATIRHGHCYFTHGSYTNMHAAAQHVRKFGGNVVYGHTHRMDAYTIRNVKSGTLSAWSPGCLCVLQPMWQHTTPTDWSHGYGLQLVNPDGSFLHINVPIIDGKSYLHPLVKAIA